MVKGSGSDASSANSTKSDLSAVKAVSAVEWKEHLRATVHSVEDDARDGADRAYGTQQFDDPAINDDPRGARFAAGAGTATGSKSVSSPKKTLQTADFWGWQAGREQDGDLTESSDYSDDEGSLLPGGHRAARGQASYTATFFGTNRRPKCCGMTLKGAAFIVACICLILLSLALALFFCCGEDEAPAGKTPVGKAKAAISRTPKAEAKRKATAAKPLLQSKEPPPKTGPAAAPATQKAGDDTSTKSTGGAGAAIIAEAAKSDAGKASLLETHQKKSTELTQMRVSASGQSYYLRGSASNKRASRRA